MKTFHIIVSNAYLSHIRKQPILKYVEDKLRCAINGKTIKPIRNY